MMLTQIAETSPVTQLVRVPYEIVHVTAGRIRIRVPKLTDDSDYAKCLSRSLGKIEAVTHTRINSAASTVVIYYDSTTETTTLYEQLRVAIQQAVTLELPEEDTITTAQRPDIDYWEKLGLPALALGLALIAGPLELPILAPIVGGAILTAGVPVFKRAIDGAIEHQSPNVGLLDSLWLTLHTLQGELLAPALEIAMAQSTETLRDLTARAGEKQALTLLNQRSYWVEREEGMEQILLSQLQVGDRVIVSPGDSIPVDGRVMRGSGLIDQQYLTGESALVACSEGQQVYASGQVVKGQFVVLAEQTGDDTHAGRTVQLVKEAPTYDTRVGDYAEELANQVVVPAMFLSAGIFAVTRDTHQAIAPLQLNFGVGIGLSVPTTILAALNYATRTGVYIRNGRALEILANLDAVVFDKTGTLTQAVGAVVGIETVQSDTSVIEILTLAVSAEQYLVHPVAEAISCYAKDKNIVARPCESWDYEVGFGVSAQIDGHKILVGSSRFLQQSGVALDVDYIRNQEGTIRNRSLVYVAKDGALLGVILYSNALRPESATVIQNLKEQGITSYILTGDNSRVASAVAYQLGINLGHTYSEAFPDRKVEIIQKLRQQGKTVAYVGDGINDSAALIHADVSIAFAVGSDIARETADIVLLDNDLRSLPHAIAIAKEAMDIVHQNMAIVAVPNIGVVLAGIFFHLNPVLGVIVSNGATILAELNGLRPLLGGDREYPVIETKTARDEAGLLGVPWQKRPRRGFEYFGT
jgi:heavy metal translocating P-type ATPase